jgi:hypothetical protein
VLLGELLAFAQDLAGVLFRGASLSVADTARAGGMYFFAFHRVAIRLHAAGSPHPGPILSVSLALLSGTALGVWLLFRGGRIAGERAGGRALTRLAAGAIVAVPYALLSLLLSYATTITFGNRLLRLVGIGRLSVDVSHLQAALWPLAIALPVALAGAASSMRTPSRGRLRTLRSAAEGGWSMLLLSLGLAFIGLLALAAVYPSSAKGYLTETFAGGAKGVDVLAHHLLALPNQSAWTVVPAMGGCDSIRGTRDTDVLCYGRFPRHADLGGATLGLIGLLPRGLSPQTRFASGPAPPGFFAFLAIPLLASLAGGFLAGRELSDGRASAAAGALAGVVFGLLTFLVALLANIEVFVHAGDQPPRSLSVGPEPLAALLLGVGWGVVGGSIGGWWAGRRATDTPAVAESFSD